MADLEVLSIVHKNPGQIVTEKVVNALMLLLAVFLCQERN